MNRIKQSILALMIVLLGGLLATPALASASFRTDACAGVNVVNGGASDTSGCTAAGTKGVNSIIKLVVNALSILVGFAAVVMIIMGGFRYITSSGDSGKASSARSTIQYAIIGLIIVAVSQVLVHFVLTRANCVAKADTTSKACK